MTRTGRIARLGAMFRAVAPRVARRGAAWIAAFALPLAAPAAEVVLPIQLDEAFLERAFVEQVFEEAGGPVTLRSRDGCGRIQLSPLGLATGSDGLLVRTRLDSRFGVPLAGLCWLTTDVAGELEVLEAPELDPDRPVVHFRVRDSRWMPSRQPLWLPGERGYALVRELVHPRLERFAVDLSEPFEELRAMLRLLWSGDRSEAAVRMADSLSLDAVETRDDALVLVLRFEVPDAPAPPARAEPALTAQEIAAFEAAWQRWDAFIGFVVQQAGGEALSPEQRLALADVLLDARYDLVAVLEAPPGRSDPVPALFVATWQRLAPVLRELNTGLPGETALRYLAFVAAGDAVQAIHELSPMGVELSADGLRRLARLVGPASRRDPLAYSTEVDPTLRELLGFGPPIPLPELPPSRPPIVAPGPTPAVPGGDGPALPPPPGASEPGRLGLPPPSAGVPGPAARRSRPPAASPAWLPIAQRVARRLAALLVSPASAEPASAAEAAPAAASPVSPDGAVPAAGRIQLQRWAPTREDVQEYLGLAGTLLRGTAVEVAEEDGGLPEPWPERFVPLVLATGWQESCWRQWVRKGGAVVPLRSGAGAVGILQVSVHVWRGVYDRDALSGSIAYNARAGSEILRHYLEDYALQRLDEAEKRDVDLVARVAYALYHGGPRHLRRPIEGGRTAALRSIDAAFLEKYEAVRDGRAEQAVAECF